MEIRSFTFDDINSLDYGVYITGSGVYDAPERDVDVISIPGRNGDLYLDNGRFNNIDVTYPASMGRMSQNDFSEKMQEFRNALLSKTGYCRLYDSYNPDEFRLGVYKSGLNVSPNKQNRAGEFDITFNCKPQRYLKSGDQSVTIEDGDTIVNPTPFESSPLLEVEGYGNIYINNEQLKIISDPLGWIPLITPISITSRGIGETIHADFNGLCYSGDMFKISELMWSVSFYINDADADTITWSNVSNNLAVTKRQYDGRITLTTRGLTNIASSSFAVGNTTTWLANLELRFTYTDAQSANHVVDIALHVEMDVLADGLTMNAAQVNVYPVSGGAVTTTTTDESKRLYGVEVNSSYSALGNPIYLDLENGNAYKYESGEYISVNSAAWLGADMPKLKPSENEITYDDTIVDLKITPRWWIV